MMNKKINKKRENLFKDSSGVAVVEMLPLLMVFVIFFGLTFGFWLSIHSGTLQSIAARHYAFEVINNRSNLFWTRDEPQGQGRPPPPRGPTDYYKKNGFRYFSVVTDQPSTASPNPDPKKRELNLFSGNPLNTGTMRDANNASPIHLKQAYGICLNHKCAPP